MSCPLIGEFIKLRTSTCRSIRGAVRGDFPVRKNAFSQSVFSAKAALEWNSIPANIRETGTYSLL